MWPPAITVITQLKREITEMKETYSLKITDYSFGFYPRQFRDNIKAIVAIAGNKYKVQNVRRRRLGKEVTGSAS